MVELQNTIQAQCSLTGVGLHTGERTTVTLKPAGPNVGISFVRIDLPGSPSVEVIPANMVMDKALARCTAIAKGNASVYTVEHLLSALAGLGIDNLVIEIDGNEVPGMDGSGLEFMRAIQKVGIKVLDAPRCYVTVSEPFELAHNGAVIKVFPSDHLKIEYTLDYGHPFLGIQRTEFTVATEVYEQQIAPCRTFCLESEAQALKDKGLGKGANFHNTLVIGERGVIQNKLRFPDECARHKVLDLIGDFYLLGKPIKAHIIAHKSGHALNRQAVLKIMEHKSSTSRGFIPDYDMECLKELDVHQIMRILPHRYPFLFVDRITNLQKGHSAVGIKNVTINDNFFTGHFPTKPIMPGVVMVEAMAQVAGIAILTNPIHRGKVALFMGVDKVKFRKIVVPGDQLIMEVKITRDRSRTVMAQGRATVNGEVVAEAELMFSFTDVSFLRQ